MVAPFLPPLKKWINQQRKLDAKRLPYLSAPETLPAEDVLSDAIVDPEPADMSAPDPTAALKQMLSVGDPSEQVAQMAAKSDTGQANALLAMLRGGPSAGLAPPSAGDMFALPITPMEQITAFPTEPPSPHYHHVNASPQRTALPPPSFPFSPQHQLRQDTARLMGQLCLRPGSDMQSSNYPQGPQPSQLSSPFHPHTNLSQGGFSSQARFSQPQDMPPQLQFPPQMQNMPSLQPQGQQGAIAHGPAAPKASQLPPPRLNNHTVGLLNAFKSPSFQQRQPSYNMAQTQQFLSQPSGPYPNGTPVYNQPHPQSFPQQNMSGSAQPPMPDRSTHQNSLLDMFRSPQAARGTSATQAPAPDSNGPQRTVSSQPVLSSQPSISAPSADPPKQRSATLAMFNRSLPKPKATSTIPSVPKASGGIFPAKAAVQQAQTSSFPQQQTVGTNFPAKEAVRQAQTSSFPQDQTKPTEDEAPKPPVTILARPTSSAAKKASPIPPPPEIAPSPGKTRPTKVASHAPAPTFSLLQRPSHATSTGPTSAERVESPAMPQTAEAPKAFQPQILTRPKREEVVTPESRNSPSGSKPQNSHGQRDALLALFNKSSLNPGRPAEGAQSVRSSSVFSGGIASPPPATDSAAFRSRLASGASMASNGIGRRDSDGLKSPTTPIEAKDFLMGFLNGVVQNEHQNRSKRQF